MADHEIAGILRFIRQRFAPARMEELTDEALLERFVSERDEAAFSTLLGRYGPLVLRVCRQALGQEQDAEDAFQATFLVLAHKAATIRRGELLPAWLHRVAFHIAVQARARNARRRLREPQGVIMRTENTLQEVEWRELGPVLHEEVNRLPEKYRRPLVLCYLDGQTHEQAADQLGWPVGTVRTRLSRGRDLLQGRLVRRGVALSTGVVAGFLAESAASAAVPATLAYSTLKGALLVAAGETAGAVGISASVLALVDGALRSMLIVRLKFMGLALLLTCLFSGGVGMVWSTGQANSPAAASARPRTSYRLLQGGNSPLAMNLFSQLAASSEIGQLPFTVSTARAMTSDDAPGLWSEPWSTSQTRERMVGLLKPGILGGDSWRLTLPGPMLGTFDRKAPREGPLALSALSAREKVHLRLLCQQDKVNFLDGGSFQAVEVPFAGSELSVVVFLPKKDGLADFERQVTVANLDRWLPLLKEWDFANVLAELQTTDACVGPPKGFVDVSQDTSVATRNEPALLLRAQHPFLLVIRNQRSNTVVFLARVDPRF